jgi:hypothetical protein
MSEAREVTSVTLGNGLEIPAEKVVCETCGTLDLNTDFEFVAINPNDGGQMYLLTCPAGHQWTITERFAK